MIVLCDVAGVLVRFDDTITFRQLQEQRVTSDQAPKMYRSPEFQQFCRGKLTPEAYVAALNATYYFGELSLEILKRAHDEHFYELSTDVLEIIQRIPREHRAIITDSNEWQEARVNEFFNVGDLSELVFQSHHTGRLKTDAGCFENVIDALDTPASEIILIDDIVKNIEGAKAAGLQTILFESVKKLELDLQRCGVIT